MRFRAINHLIFAGVHLLTRPRYSTTVVVSGSTYYYASGYYYAQQGTQYVVVNPPPAAVVYAVPASTTVVYAGDKKYYYDGGTYYVLTDEKAQQPPPPTSSDSGSDSAQKSSSDSDKDGATINEVEMTEAPEEGKNFKVVEPPVGSTVPYLPDSAKEKKIDGKKYWVVGDAYYQAFVSGGDTIYMVVKKPENA
jgi:hypothetical protein